MNTLFPKDGDSKYDRLIITGHSLGGGLCVASGTCVACECPGVPLITMHSIAGAPFGDANFKIAFQDKKDKRMAKVTMFRTINDQDIIPQLGAAVRWGYCYDIAPKVVLTQKTLAWNPSQEVEDDGQGGRGELIEDHFLDGPGGYLALLYMYTVQARIQDDKVYNTLYYAYRCLRIPNTTWALRHQGSHYDSRWEGSESSTTQMCSYWLTSKCGFSDVDVALLFPEMRRLCVEASGSPGGSSFGHFLMACRERQTDSARGSQEGLPVALSDPHHVRAVRPGQLGLPPHDGVHLGVGRQSRDRHEAALRVGYVV
jgi:hypothetical protein